MTNFEVTIGPDQDPVMAPAPPIEETQTVVEALYAQIMSIQEDQNSLRASLETLVDEFVSSNPKPLADLINYKTTRLRRIGDLLGKNEVDIRVLGRVLGLAVEQQEP